MRTSLRTSQFFSPAGFAIAAGLFVPETLYAQEEASAQEVPAGADILVTARKTRESLISVPVAVTALTSDDIANRGITNINDLNGVAPGLRNQNSSVNRNDRSFTVIGFRGMWGDGANRQGSTVFLDGIAVPGGNIPGLNDIERIEVVSGPQSAYFGRSTFSGAINFVTKTPGFEPKARLDLSYGAYDTRDFNATVELPLVEDQLTVRLSGRHYHTRGQYKNVGYGGRLGERETNSWAVTVYARPTETLTLRAFHTSWQDSDGPSAQATLTQADYNCAANPANPALNYICGSISRVPASRFGFNDTLAPSFLTADAITPSGFINHFGLEREQSITNLLIDQEIGDFTLSGAFGISENNWSALTDTYGQPPDGTGYASSVLLNYFFESMSGELRLSSDPNKPLRGSVGVNYYDETVNVQTRAFRPTAANPNPPITELLRPSIYSSKTFGIFGALHYDITPALTLSLEGRYQWDTPRQQVLIANGADLKRTFTSFSPRAILSYEFGDSKEFYVSYAKGTRPGWFNAVLTTVSAFGLQEILAQVDAPLAVPEEKLTSYEAGVKGLFLDRRLRVLLAVYYGEWRDRQVNQNISYRASPTATSFSTATVALPGSAVNLWGIELQTMLRVSDALTLEGTFNYAETDIRSSSCTDCLAINGVLNNVGNRLGRYPAYTGTGSATYETPVFGDWNGYVRADYIYTGSQYDTEANVLKLSDSHRVNARLGIRNESYTVEIFATNLLNDLTPSNIVRNTNPRTGGNAIVLAAPEKRTIGARVAVTF